MERDDKPTGHVYRYPMVSVATDIVLLNLPRDGGLQVALVRRRPDSEAYANRWALPGGFLRTQEDLDLDACVRRELLEEVGVANPHLELIGVYSAIDRDPRPERVISVAYLSVLKSDAPELSPIFGTDVVEARWVPLTEIADWTYEGEALAFDHSRILADARRLIDDRIPFGRREETAPDLLFAFLPEEFTLGQATLVMTHLKGKVDPSNFRKYLLAFVEPTGASQRTSTRSAALYRQRVPDLSAEKEPPIGLRTLRQTAREAQIHLFDLFLATLEPAPSTTINFLENVVKRYAAHRDLRIDVSRTPELRITDRNTGRPLVALSWDTGRAALTATALADPAALAGVGLAELGPNRTGPHRSRFRPEPEEGGEDRLGEALRISRNALVTDEDATAIE
ncbi:MAG: NUDIX hydrolase [Rubellimicrobium sp.]|nr:NUDIX hydrolase [Rubellimicrobium sp.]